MGLTLKEVVNTYLANFHLEMPLFVKLIIFTLLSISMLAYMCMVKVYISGKK